VARFLERLLAAPEVKPLLSSEHFSVVWYLTIRIGLPTAHWSGSMTRVTICRPVEAKDLAAIPPR